MSRKKRQRLVNRKKVIDLLKDKPRRHKELVDETGLSESTIDRILNELKTLGLAEKEKLKRLGHWKWYTYVEKYTPSRYNLEIKHAEKLLLGFNAFLETLPSSLLSYRKRKHPSSLNSHVVKSDAIRRREESYRLSQFAEEHLQTGYPDIHEHLIDFRVLSAKLEQLKKKIGGHLPEDLRETVLRELTVSCGDAFLENKDKYMKVPSLKQLAKDFDDFLQTQKSTLETYQKLAAGIHMIRMMVERGGTPLRGRCGLCPNIIIEEDEQKINLVLKEP